MAPSDPTTVTSSPSSSHVTPSAITTRQCQRDQGSASRRAGIVVVTIVPVVTTWDEPWIVDRGSWMVPFPPSASSQQKRAATPPLIDRVADYPLSTNVLSGELIRCRCPARRSRLPAGGNDAPPRSTA